MGRRDEARAETTAKILAAAREQIATVGGVGLSMRAVAREVGMVSSAVYRYFPTREDLLTAMILESYRRLAAALARADSKRYLGEPDADRWVRLAEALRVWGLGSPHEFQLIYGTPIPGYVAPPETVPAAGAVAAPFLACVGRREVAGFLPTGEWEGMAALAVDTGTTTSGAAAVVAAISELVGFVGHELAGHFVGLAESATGLFDAVVLRQCRELGLGCGGEGDDDEAGEWGLRFVAELARSLACRPGLETARPGDAGYRVDEVALEGGQVRLVWAFPDVADEAGRPVRVGRVWDLAELRAGFSPDGPGVVAGAVILNDFYPLSLPPAECAGPDGIRWLGTPPQR